MLLNTWMWPFDDDARMQRSARLVEGRLGRFLYRRLNVSLRLLMPSAYGRRRLLTRAVHRQYLAPFPAADDRERVLWALARALRGSRAHYAALWEARAALADLPALIVWGMRDPAFRPEMLARWTQALPRARVLSLEGAGHWPHEEEPEEVLAAVRALLAA